MDMELTRCGIKRYLILYFTIEHTYKNINLAEWNLWASWTEQRIGYALLNAFLNYILQVHIL